jgi:hypothetical protein
LSHVISPNFEIAEMRSQIKIIEILQNISFHFIFKTKVIEICYNSNLTLFKIVEVMIIDEKLTMLFQKVNVDIKCAEGGPQICAA